MLIPLLYSLPTVKIDSTELPAKEYLNLTMGLSIEKTPLFTLVDNLFNMQANFSTDEHGQKLVYFRDILKILRHPYLQYSTRYAQDYDKIQEHIIYIQKENLVYVPLETLQEWGKETSFYHVVFRHWNNSADQALQALFDLCKILSELFDDQHNVLENEFLLQFFMLLKRIESVLGQYRYQINVRTLQQFLYETIHTTLVPFTGEPLSPLQIMGMLESRTLDFERLIILSCNEGIMPKGKQYGSVIPMDIRKRFGIPTHTENDATYAYTFYRLLHRARDITLIYVDAVGGQGINTAEKSRYITQIEAELAPLPNITFHHYRLQLRLPEKHQPLVQVEKTPETLAMTRQYLSQGITPSAINLYIENPLAFFQRYVLGLEEAQEIEEEIMDHTFGAIVHRVLEQFLKRHERKLLTAEEIASITAEYPLIEKLLEESIVAIKGGIVTHKGKNYLLKRIASWLIQRFLEGEQAKAPLYLLAQETLMTASLSIKIADHQPPVEVLLKGKADRIDICDHQLRIVDYKTGALGYQSLTAPSLIHSPLDPDKGKIVQLMLYKYLFVRLMQTPEGKRKMNEAIEYVENFNIVSGFYFFRYLTEGFQAYSLGDEPKNAVEFIQYVEEFLRQLIGEMLDPAVPFAPRSLIGVPDQALEVNQETEAED